MTNTEFPSDSNVLSHIIQNRRTIKPGNYQDKEVPKQFVEKILDNAQWAPSHGCTFPWRFFIYAGDARKGLANTLCDIYREITTEETYREKKSVGLRQNILKAPVVIAIALKRDTTKKISELDEVMAVACATQNIHLTATSFGLGGFWSTHIAAMSEQFAAHLGLDHGDRALGLFFLGYPQTQWPIGDRGPISKVSEWHGL
jgi:nitroreductase